MNPIVVGNEKGQNLPPRTLHASAAGNPFVQALLPVRSWGFTIKHIGTHRNLVYCKLRDFSIKNMVFQHLQTIFTVRASRTFIRRVLIMAVGLKTLLFVGPVFFVNVCIFYSVFLVEDAPMI